MKNTLSQKYFFDHLLDIYNYKVLKQPYNKETLKDKILSLCKNVKPFEHEKFYYEPEYYNNLVYNEKDISNIKKINIIIEFVENDKQQDIWNYYRRYVSSLKKIKDSKLAGRQIYMLIKDSITTKYIGILSLNSDYYGLEDRDNYIGWDLYQRKDKLKYIMNISTCVPLQPFGFNFNAGKLLATLAFSKEVSNYYKNKYNEPLLGLTTTSLYGKSIQYDRLPDLKFVGYTKGNSVYSIPSEVTKLCSQYLKSTIGYTSSRKFIILQKAFDTLNIPKEDILTSNPKGIYFGFTHPNSKDYLTGKTNIIPDFSNNKINTATEIFNWWIDRWATQRYQNLIKTNRLKNDNSVNE